MQKVPFKPLYVNPFYPSSTLVTTCPFCEKRTHFQCPELLIDHSKETNASFIPDSYIQQFNTFAPHHCENCFGLYYLGKDKKVTTGKIFFGDQDQFAMAESDFDLMYDSVPSNTVFIIRGTFSCGKSYCAQKIIKSAPRVMASIIEVDDGSGYSQSSQSVLAHVKENQSVANLKLQQILSQKADVIIICGILQKLEYVEDFLVRLEESPTDYGVQIINLNKSGHF